uniref:Uncharacterized protein n=1 Tax=Romanomermis culicivorax TaxID=13658 RepID=A0A915JS12_ROMCU
MVNDTAAKNLTNELTTPPRKKKSNITPHSLKTGPCLYKAVCRSVSLTIVASVLTNLTMTAKHRMFCWIIAL